jgi:hypothetical protein
MGGLVLAGNTSGSTTLQATDAVTATITLPSATDTLVGKITPSFTTTIGVGAATPSASGAGITFPATQSASTDANTLDDYEEGTWTPTITAGVGSYTTVTSQAGSYTKIGRQVTLTWFFNVTNKGTGSGYVNISNLPFASNGTRYAGIGYDTYSAVAQVANFSVSTTSIDVYKYDATDPIVAGKNQVGQITYFV